MTIQYCEETDLSLEEFADVLRRSTLAERRPMDEPQTLQGMLDHADVLLTARSEGRLVGISRAITDRAYCTYLSELAVDVDYQGQGIGKQLLRRTHEAAGLQTNLVLLAAPNAETYYPHVGMQHRDSCFTLARRPPERDRPRTEGS